MLRGMKGYQLTPGDLEFIQKMQEEKLITKLKVGLFFEDFPFVKIVVRQYKASSSPLERPGGGAEGVKEWDDGRWEDLC